MALTKVTYSLIVGAPINVADYGAVGDGSTDDTSAFVAAIAAAATKNSAVYVPAVTNHYKITNELTLANNVMVFGDGWGSAIRQYTRDKNCFIAANSNVIRDLHLQGDNITTTSADDKNCGIFASAKNNLMIDSCFGTRFQNGLCQLRNCTNYKIIDNWCYANPYSIAAGATNGDIVIYSVTAATGARGVISRNHCLSNNDFGIFFDANGFDLDVVISENVCVTLDGAVEATNGGNRRHALIAAYGGAVGGRTVITSNICRNTRLTGIYRASASAPSGTHLIANNFCSANGYENNSLSGGIFINVGSPGTKLISNVVENFRGNLNLGNAGIVINNTPVPLEVRANTIQSSQGHGILLVGTTQATTVADNLLRNNAIADIAVQHSGSGTDGGGHEIINNKVVKQVNTKPAIRLVLDASTRTIRVANNRAYGTDKTTASGGENAFLNIEGSTTTPVSIVNNETERFYYGVYYYANIQAGRGGFHHVIDNNQFRDLDTGVYALRGSTNDCLPVCGNTFSSVTNPVDAGAYLAERKGIKFALTGLTNAPPSDGTWAVGDISWRTAPAAGGAPGDVCTTAGSPGTWKAMANVAA